MATNEVFDHGRTLYVPVPSGKLSGDPVVMGQVPGVAQIDRQADGHLTMKRDGMHKLPVKGIDGSGNSAVVGGDILYYTEGDTPPISKKATGVRFGYVGPDQAVASGATATIDVIIGY